MKNSIYETRLWSGCWNCTNKCDDKAEIEAIKYLQKMDVDLQNDSIMEKGTFWAKIWSFPKDDDNKPKKKYELKHQSDSNSNFNG